MLAFCIVTEVRRRDRRHEPEPLTSAAAEFNDQSEQLLALHMLGDGGNAQDLAQPNNGAQQTAPVRAMLCSGYEAAVELDLIEPELAQIADRSVARAEIIEHDCRPRIPKLGKI